MAFPHNDHFYPTPPSSTELLRNAVQTGVDIFVVNPPPLKNTVQAGEDVLLANYPYEDGGGAAEHLQRQALPPGYRRRASQKQGGAQ